MSASNFMEQLIQQAHGIGDGFHLAPGPLADAAKMQVEEKNKALVGEYRGILELFQGQLESAVRDLRSQRASEKVMAGQVERRDRCFRYFTETSNPFPMYDELGLPSRARNLCERLGIVAPPAEDAAWKVPTSWKPTPVKAEVSGTPGSNPAAGGK